MHEVIGQRPSVSPVSLFASGSNSVERPQTPVSEDEAEASSASGSTDSSGTETADLQAGNQTHRH